MSLQRGLGFVTQSPSSLVTVYFSILKQDIPVHMEPLEVVFVTVKAVRCKCNSQNDVVLSKPSDITKCIDPCEWDI